MRLLLEWLEAGVAPEVVWGVVPRVVGALYVIAFWSIAPQVLGLIGSRGIAPIAEQLAALRRNDPGLRRFVRLPTLLWLHHGDALLRTLPLLGVACGAYVVIGGVGSSWALLACWALYLSLDGCSLMFPWDCLLFEAGFLAIFLPEVPRLPVLVATELPLPIVSFAFRLLIIRLMWGFAKLKFIGTKRGDSLYLRGFLAWMPMCTPLGYRMQRAPAWLLRGGYAFMWFAEVVCPLLAFFRGTPRAIAALGLTGLMAGIGATGNWGFFNIGYGALCFVLLDTQSSLFDTTLAQVTAGPGSLILHVLLALHTLGALLYFPLNSWATHTFVHWPYEDITWKRPWLRALIAFYRELAPFRWLHAYGVFPPNASPPIKVIPVFEGSLDGVHYESYEYRYMPSHEHSGAPVIAPHHPRIDHLCVYAGSGMSESDYLASLVGAGKPFGFSPFSHFSWLHRLAERLLEAEPSVLALLGRDPFFGRPPNFVRVSLRALTPASDDEFADGQRWRVRHLGVAFAARARNPLVFSHWLPPPELGHPDFVHWRKKSVALTAMVRAHGSGTPHEVAVRMESDLREDEVARFWTEFVPLVASTRGDFERIDEAARELRERFGEEQNLRFERLVERYAYLLRRVLEPYFYGDALPNIAKRSNFRFHLLLHECILDGLSEYELMLREPGRAAARAERQSDESALHLIGVVRNETIRYHGRALRIARRMTNVVEPFIPGILEFKELLTRHVPEDEDWLPICERAPNGEWSCEGFLSGTLPGG
jgi:hypothetical protein